MIMRSLLAAAAMLLPAVASAQALQCTAPGFAPRPHVEGATDKEPQRLLPIGGYTLALTWAPEYCHGHKGDAQASFQCGSGNRFGFTLHGLWPDGIGKEWPQYCKSAALLPSPVIAANLCATPSAQLLQHEWTKHGTCMGNDPADYFRRSTGMYAKLAFPDTDALSRARALTVGKFADAFAAANHGLPASAVRVTVNPRGWLDELWLCLDKSFAYARCRADSGGAPREASLKIWRGARGDFGEGGSSGERSSYRRSSYRRSAY